ncbi:MAG TPA: lipase maturation factor family protein [Terriglobia bacterium]|nr:lipase maturation factor family protein [Terriglobia bacterium]
MTPDQPANSALPDNSDAPPRPLLLFDGDCGFCRFWVARWRAATRGQVDFAPAQTEAARFPQITPEAWKRSVQLVTPDGAVYAGAEAVFRTLAYAPEQRWRLALYRHLPGARPVSEWGYRVVAAHRDFFSKLTALALGRDPQPSSYFLSRWVFLRLLGLIYLISFLSLRVQITGLVGARGILPAGDFLQAVAANFGSASYRLFPTLAWISSSDASLKLLCTGGAILSLLVVLGVATGPALVLCWGFYLSLVTVGRDFLSFQWDILLLEAGFLAIFLAPWRPLEPPWRAGSSRPSTAVLWLLRWLLFRLMFLSGSVKLVSGDPTWRNLTALEYHYWTQPIPTPVAWFAAQLPAWFQRMSVVGVFAVELGVPFLIFAPRRIRKAGALVIVAFQLTIAFTGNYAFFNLLTIAFCVLLLDDGWWRRWLPKRLAGKISGTETAMRPAPAGKIVRAVLAAVLLVISGSQLLMTLNEGAAVPGFAHELVDWQAPFFLANSYGLFAVMTTSRLEIEVEGSDDGETWRPYEFKYKPGDPARRPPWVAPYQPRLDWQMWFAALGSYQQNRWFVNFLVRLLQGSPEVTALLAKNPFPSAPPLYIRAQGFEYHFTDFAARRANGDWWRRELKGAYFPEASLRGK